MYCINPSAITSETTEALELRFRHLLDVLISKGHLAAELGDAISRQYAKFLTDQAILSTIRSVSTLPDSEKRLDKMYHAMLAKNQDYRDL